MFVRDRITIKGYTGSNISFSAGIVTSTPTLEAGTYELSCDTDLFIRIAASKDDAQSVTASNGYRVFGGNTVPVNIDSGDRIGIVSDSAGVLYYHRIG